MKAVQVPSPFRWLIAPTLVVVGGFTFAAGSVLGVWAGSDRSLSWVVVFVAAAFTVLYLVGRWFWRPGTGQRSMVPEGLRTRWPSAETLSRLAYGGVATGVLAGLLISVALTVDIPGDPGTMLRVALVLAALPPVRWIIGHLTPARREARDVARAALGGYERSAGISADGSPRLVTQLTVINRSNHEIHNVTLMVGVHRPAVEGVADLLLPGEESARIEVSGNRPGRVDVLFEDFEGRTWVHVRSVYFVLRTDSTAEQAGEEKSEFRMVAVGGGAYALLGWLNSTHGLSRLGISIDEYVAHRRRGPRSQRSEAEEPPGSVD